jgi:hypothetical protein
MVSSRAGQHAGKLITATAACQGDNRAGKLSWRVRILEAACADCYRADAASAETIAIAPLPRVARRSRDGAAATEPQR